MRALIAASGTPITNTLGEMFTIQQFFQPDMLVQRGIQEFDAWAAAFGETTTDLELQPSELYKPVTRFAEFVNIPELIAMFRDFADVVLQSELRQEISSSRGSLAASARSSLFPRAPPSRPTRGFWRNGSERSNSASANPRRATTSCSRSSPTAAMPRSTSGSSTPTDRRGRNKLNPMIAKVFEIWRRRPIAALRPDGAPDPISGATNGSSPTSERRPSLQGRGFSGLSRGEGEADHAGVLGSEISLHPGPAERLAASSTCSTT